MNEFVATLWGEPGGANEKRHSRDFGGARQAVDEVSASFAHCLAMVCGEDNDGFARTRSCVNSLHNLADPMVRKGNLFGVSLLILRQAIEPLDVLVFGNPVLATECSGAGISGFRRGTQVWRYVSLDRCIRELLGTAHAHRGEFTKAEGRFRNALQIEPSNLEARRRLRGLWVHRTATKQP